MYLINFRIECYTSAIYRIKVNINFGTNSETEFPCKFCCMQIRFYLLLSWPFALIYLERGHFINVYRLLSLRLHCRFISFDCINERSQYYLIH